MARAKEDTCCCSWCDVSSFHCQHVDAQVGQRGALWQHQDARAGTMLHHGLSRKKCKRALAMRQSSSYPRQFCCPTFILVTQLHIREVSPPHLFGSQSGGKHNLTPLPLRGSGVTQPQGKKEKML